MHSNFCTSATTSRLPTNTHTPCARTWKEAKQCTYCHYCEGIIFYDFFLRARDLIIGIFSVVYWRNQFVERIESLWDKNDHVHELLRLCMMQSYQTWFSLLKLLERGFVLSLMGSKYWRFTSIRIRKQMLYTRLTHFLMSTSWWRERKLSLSFRSHSSNHNELMWMGAQLLWTRTPLLLKIIWNLS